MKFKILLLTKSGPISQAVASIIYKSEDQNLTVEEYWLQVVEGNGHNFQTNCGAATFYSLAVHIELAKYMLEPSDLTIPERSNSALNSIICNHNNSMYNFVIIVKKRFLNFGVKMYKEIAIFSFKNVCPTLNDQTKVFFVKF